MANKPRRTYGRGTIARRLTMDEAVSQLGSRRAAQFFGCSHSFVKTWMRQNMPRVRRSAALSTERTNG